MSLGGLLVSIRGVEAKDLALHIGAALALILLAAVQFAAPTGRRSEAGRIARYAQILLGGWVALSLLSSLWSGAPSFSAGQGALYALALAWAVALGHTFERHLLPRLLAGVATISTLTAILCIWYYYERNPYHRPGFPLGNPTLVGAALVPGVIIAICHLAAVASEWRRQGTLRRDLPTFAAVVALIPLIWCFAIVQTRAAILALLVALGLLILLNLGRRIRWVVAGLLLVGFVTLGGWLLSASQLDLAMARGASLRFRIYAWRYAAHFWQSHPFAGNGAGAYPRLAGQLSTQDEALDPAAFMAEIVEHAHNELFEVLAEIGLVGGVTYVGGLLGTFAAASLALRRTRPGRQRWYVLAILLCTAASLTDSMFGVTVRLPGGAALLFTLLGILWATCRTTPDDFEAANVPRASRRNSRTAAAACVLAAVAAFALAVTNWIGVTQEYGAHTAADDGRYATALHQSRVAERRLLDPVRKLASRKLALQCQAGLAQEAFVHWSQAATTAPDDSRWHRAVGAATQTYNAALALRQVIPALDYTDATAASAAEQLFHLHRQRDPQAASAWLQRAEQSWRRQRERTPYDVQTLLALMQYPAPLDSHIALLRDALRFGKANGPWLAALHRLSQTPGFDERVGQFLNAITPLTPDTDLDSLIASMAPETHRLVAAALALRGAPQRAVDHAGRAARLYAPMSVRFPQQRAVALGEQAQYLLQIGPDQARPAAAVYRLAIDALPVIQAQKYEEAARPLRFGCALALLVAGDTSEGVDMVRRAIGPDADDPLILEQTLQRLVHQVNALGLPPETIARIAADLCPDFPSFCEPDAAGRP